MSSISLPWLIAGLACALSTAAPAVSPLSRDLRADVDRGPTVMQAEAESDSAGDELERVRTRDDDALHGHIGAALTNSMRDVEPSAAGWRMGERVAQVSATAPALTIKGGISVWAWNGQDLLAAAQGPSPENFWNDLKRLSVSRLFFSMGARQIDDASTNPKPLTDFLDAARQHGVAVELLLGEPSWIDPANRPKLVQIIQRLRAFKFSALHLDIEPDQIYKQPLTPAQFNNWMATYKAASSAAPWPTSVDVHPRYFRDSPYPGWHVASKLQAVGVKEVDLMIFNANPQAVANIALPVLASAPQLQFRVGQSVEPELEATLSYAGRSPAVFQTAMQKVQSLLAVRSNFRGIAVQAWSDLLTLEK